MSRLTKPTTVEEDDVDLRRDALGESRLVLAHRLLQPLHRRRRRVVGLAPRREDEDGPAVPPGRLEGREAQAAAGHHHAADRLVPHARRAVHEDGAHPEGAEEAEHRALSVLDEEPVLDAADSVHEGEASGGRTRGRPHRRPRRRLDPDVDPRWLVVLADLDRALVLRGPGIEAQARRALRLRRHRIAVYRRGWPPRVRSAGDRP
jgi:hypothetical protein